LSALVLTGYKTLSDTNQPSASPNAKIFFKNLHCLKAYCVNGNAVLLSSSFGRVVTVHCQAALDLGANVEQPFNCFIVQNRQAVQFMRRSMDWTLEDNMVVGSFFCATLTGRRGGHTPNV